MRSYLNNLPELHQRIITGLIGGTILLSSVYWHEWSYFAVFFGICAFTQIEFYKLVGLDGTRLPLKSFGTLNGLFIFVLTFLIHKYDLNTNFYYLIFIALSGVYFIKLYVKTDLTPFANIAFTFLGVMYVAIPFALLNTVVFMDGAYSPQIILGTLFLIWANDTGAYFSGRAFGKRKLFYRISPKKTWEGSIGGGLLALSVGFGISKIFTHLESWQWLCISLIIIIAGTYGDLVESLFKRSMRIKDSGNSIPGHGGFLDRFDSLLLAAPFIVTFLKLFSK